MKKICMATFLLCSSLNANDFMSYCEKNLHKTYDLYRSNRFSEDKVELAYIMWRLSAYSEMFFYLENHKDEGQE